MKTRHILNISDSLGNRLLTAPKFFGGSYVRAENEIGSLTVRFPGDIPIEFFKWQGRIEVYRIVDSLMPILAENTVWLINKVSKTIHGKERAWEVEAVCANSILTYRTVDYNQNNSYTLKLATADNMGKAIMRENFGSSATDATRSIASYLTIDADLGAAQTVKKAFENRVVLDILKELAESSTQAGTYLVFDVTYENGLFVFRSYTTQRGNDHRFPSGSAGPLVVGPDFGNFSDAKVTYDYSNVWTRGIISGDSTAGVYSKARVNNTTLQGLSPLGLIEAYESTQNQVADSTLLTSEANALVRKGVPKIAVSGKLTNTPYFVYGVHWNWGDFITVQVDGVGYDMHVEKVAVPIGLEPMEDQSVEVILRSE